MIYENVVTFAKFILFMSFMTNTFLDFRLDFVSQKVLFKKSNVSKSHVVR